MTVSSEQVEEAFRFFLGRAPRADNPPQFASISELTHVLMHSPEFRNSKRAKKSPITWPLAQVFISRRNKVLYCPIGKNACTFMKRHMVRISDIPFADFILPGIHTLTDHVCTGVQLSDYAETDVARIIQDSEYFKFALLREPGQRLLSAYFEKFVLRRMDAGNRHHTAAVIWAVQQKQGFTKPDFDHGITFRDFVTYIVGQQPLNLDAHWRPQYTYLQGISWDQLYPLEYINKAVELLENRSGIRLDRQPDNATNSGQGIFYSSAADLLPKTLLRDPPYSQNSFIDGAIADLIRQYFKKDHELYQRAHDKMSDNHYENPNLFPL